MRRVMSVLHAVWLSTALSAGVAAADPVRVTVANAPAGVPLAAILNAGNQSKPLTQTGSSNGSLTFAMLADAANYGKPVQVYLVEEDDDDDTPAGIYFVLDGGRVPAGGRLLDTFTLTPATSEIVIDYRTGRVSVRETSGEIRDARTSFGRGLQFGFHGERVTFTNAGGGDICSTAPQGTRLTSCDLGDSGNSFMFSTVFGFTPWLGVGVGYETASEVTLDRVLTNAANPNVTATQTFRYDPKAFEIYGRLSLPVAERVQLTALVGGARVTSESSNTIVTRFGGNVVNTQTTNTDNESWSPLLGGSATIWVNQWLGVEGGYRWMRMEDGNVDEPMHKLTGGVLLNIGPR